MGASISTVQRLRWELGVHRRLVNGSMARALVAKPPLPKLVTLGIDVPGTGTFPSPESHTKPRSKEVANRGRSIVQKRGSSKSSS